MNKLTRRTFGKRVLAAGALPLLKLELQTSNPEPQIIIPDKLAGYKLSAEEKLLATKFLTTQEKNMAPLRERDLPNSLAPSFVFASPIANGEKRKRKK
jgi:hypothetical protein